MKKIALSIVFVFVFLCTAYCELDTISAQDFNSEKAYQDYVFTRSNYDISYTNYEKARDTYVKNQTLSLKEEARLKTIEMLKNRDDLYRVYLTAIRTKVSETKGLNNDEKSGLYTKLDSDVSYYQGHKMTYTGNETLETVFKINTDVENHYKSTTLPFVYEALFMISYGQQVGLRQDHQTVYQSLIDLLNKKIADGKLIIDPFNRWVIDITGLMDILQKNENLGKTQIQEIYTKKSTNLSGTYSKAVDTLQNSVSNLQKLNNFVSEFMIALNNQI